MERFSCTTASHLANEDPIATAYPVNTYVLVECTLPWAAKAWESPQIPDLLRKTITHVTEHYPAVKALLINQDRTRSSPDRRVIIYQRQNCEFVSGFDRYEFVIDTLDEAASLIQNFFKGIFLRTFLIQRVEDILVCTHGSRDQCCGRYGEPFYAQAYEIVRSQNHSRQVWRSSHIGGHRFAPTAVTFPDGRYYARLDAFSFNSLLQRSGDINLITPIYRGSSLIPEALQELERALLLRYGWDWLGFRVKAEMRSMHPENAEAGILAQIQWQDYAKEITTAQAHLFPDPTRTVSLQSSCQMSPELTYIKYILKNIVISRPLATAIAS